MTGEGEPLQDHGSRRAGEEGGQQVMQPEWGQVEAAEAGEKSVELKGRKDKPAIATREDSDAEGEGEQSQNAATTTRHAPTEQTSPAGAGESGRSFFERVMENDSSPFKTALLADGTETGACHTQGATQASLRQAAPVVGPGSVSADDDPIPGVDRPLSRGSAQELNAGSGDDNDAISDGGSESQLEAADEQLDSPRESSVKPHYQGTRGERGECVCESVRVSVGVGGCAWVCGCESMCVCVCVSPCVCLCECEGHSPAPYSFHTRVWFFAVNQQAERCWTCRNPPTSLCWRA